MSRLTISLSSTSPSLVILMSPDPETSLLDVPAPCVSTRGEQTKDRCRRRGRSAKANNSPAGRNGRAGGNRGRGAGAQLAAPGTAGLDFSP